MQSGLGILAIIWLLGSSCGCIVIPIPHPSSTFEGSRAAIPEDALKRVRPGERIEQVILSLGEPDHAIGGERLLVWHWTTCEWSILIASGAGYAGGAAILDIPHNHYFVVAFDDGGGVARRDRLHDKDFKTVPAEAIERYRENPEGAAPWAEPVP